MIVDPGRWRRVRELFEPLVAGLIEHGQQPPLQPAVGPSVRALVDLGHQVVEQTAEGREILRLRDFFDTLVSPWPYVYSVAAGT